jgi:hypothetical protein
VFHLELRDFPHNMCRFNLSDEELHPIVEMWSRGQVLEYGEHRWNPQNATMKVLEGPQLPLGQLTMGRGWTIAERQGTDVTDRLIAAARDALFAGGGGPGVASGAGGAGGAVASAPLGSPGAGGGAVSQGAAAGPAGAPLGDSFALGMQMAALLGPDAMRLLDAWRAAAASSPGLAPSETLAKAEGAVRSADAAGG